MTKNNIDDSRVTIYSAGFESFVTQIFSNPIKDKFVRHIYMRPFMKDLNIVCMFVGLFNLVTVHEHFKVGEEKSESNVNNEKEKDGSSETNNDKAGS